MPDMPQWVAATIRYTITVLGVILAANDIVPEAVWDQITPALISIVTALYGVWRTKEEEDLSRTKTNVISFLLADDLGEA